MKAIVAVTPDFGIGSGGRLLYRSKEDFEHFKEITTGGVLIMGRKTFEEIGKPLEDRIIIVLSSTENDYKMRDVYVSKTKDEAIEMAKSFDRDIYISGGEAIYDAFINEINELYLTIFHTSDIKKPDKFFNHIDKFIKVSSRRTKSSTGITIDFINLIKDETN